MNWITDLSNEHCLDVNMTTFVEAMASLQREGAKGAVPPKNCLCPPISVYSVYVFKTSRNDETTDKNGKRNNNVVT